MGHIPRFFCEHDCNGGDASCGAKLYTLKVRLITNKETNKPRGYAFVEYMHTRDMKTAYKQADGQKMEGRRVLVDVERGRTVPNWRPRRLGGGLGSTRVGGEELNQKYSGREPQQFASGASRSEEPRAREDRHVDRVREKSRDRGRDREREKSRERSHDRIRERDPREERHHRDRDRNRDRDRERDRGLDHDRDYDWSRDRDRGRDRGRDRDRDRDRNRDYGRDRDRGRDIDRDSTRDRRHSRERDYERGDRERTRERESDYDYVEPRRKREVEEEREGELEHGEHGHDHERFDGLNDHGHAYLEPDRGYKQPKPEEYNRHVSEPENDREQYEQKLEPDNGREPYDLDPAHDHDRYEKADELDSDYNQYDRAETDLPRERAREGYERSRRSISRDYER